HGKLSKHRVGRCPHVDYLVVTLVVSDQTHVIVHGDRFYLLVCFCDEIFLTVRNDDISKAERQSAFESEFVTHVLDIVEECCCCWNVGHGQNLSDDITERLLGEDFVDVTCSFRNYLIEQYTSCCSLDDFPNKLSFFVEVFCTNFNPCVELEPSFVQGDVHFLSRIECQSFSENFVVW